MERAPKGKELMLSQQREPPKRCPRCDSTNTKFCYFNNYSQSQPRHFCRACRRYWTEGGTLRSVSQGGGSHHREKRPRTQAAASASRPKAPATAPALVPPQLPPPPLTTFLIGGGDGSGGVGGMPGSGNFQTFHPGNNSATSMMANFIGFRACYDQVCFNPTAPGFLNIQNYPQMPPLKPPPPPFDPNLVIASHQQMNITVFTSTTTMTTAVATTVSAAETGGINIDGDVGFWNNSEFSIQGDDQEGSSPPTPAPNPSDST